MQRFWKDFRSWAGRKTAISEWNIAGVMEMLKIFAAKQRN
jgi:hypothetical protein